MAIRKTKRDTKSRKVAPEVSRAILEEVVGVIAKAVPEAIRYNTPPKPAAVTLEHWDAPISGSTSDHEPAISVADLADRVETVKALGYSLVIDVVRDTSRGLYIPNAKGERIVFKAVQRL